MSNYLALEKAYLSLIIVINRITAAVLAIISAIGLYYLITVFTSLSHGFAILLALGISVAIAVVTSCIIAYYQHYYYRHYSYALDEEKLVVCRGVFWRKSINVPRNRVQYVDVNTGPLERKQGLATLVVYTAGTVYAYVKLAGITPETAAALRQELISGNYGESV